MATIDDLNVDVLLTIFNMLTLYDKLMAMMVNRKWYNIIHNTHAWKRIDFNEEGPVRNTTNKRYKRFLAKQGRYIFDFREVEERWKFPHCEDDVVGFLTLFAGEALQEIYLHSVSRNIMVVLIAKSPNVHTICSLETDISFRVDVDDVDQMLHIPQSLKRFEFYTPYLPSQVCDKDQDHKHESEEDCSRHQTLRDDKLFSRLAQCPNLSHLALRGLPYTSLCCFQKFMNNTKLRVVDLEIVTNELDWDNPNPIDELLANSIGTFTAVSNLCLTFDITHDIALYDFLQCVANWKHLRTLVLKKHYITLDSFQVALPGLKNLEHLEIMLKDSGRRILTLIGEFLLKLKHLTLDGQYCTLLRGLALKSLTHHHSLQSISLHYMLSDHPDPQFFHFLFNVIPTIPNLSYVKVAAYSLPEFLFRIQKTFVFPKTTAEIEILEVTWPWQGVPPLDCYFIEDQKTWKKL